MRAIRTCMYRGYLAKALGDYRSNIGPKPMLPCHLKTHKVLKHLMGNRKLGKAKDLITWTSPVFYTFSPPSPSKRTYFIAYLLIEHIIELVRLSIFP